MHDMGISVTAWQPNRWHRHGWKCQALAIDSICVLSQKHILSSVLAIDRTMFRGFLVTAGGLTQKRHLSGACYAAQVLHKQGATTASSGRLSSFAALGATRWTPGRQNKTTHGGGFSKYTVQAALGPDSVGFLARVH